MATFSMDSIGDISLVNDFPKVQSYLYRLEKQLKYTLSNLDPDENYSENARLIYAANAEKQAALELSLDQISLSMVTRDNVVAAINLSESGVKIQGDKISLEGVTTFNNNVTIGLDGTIHAVNGVFQGDISASTISGSKITAGGSDDSSITVNDKDGNPVAILNKLGVDVRAGSIKGANVEVGGTGNTNGTLIVRNASGAGVVTLNNGGISIINGALSVTGGGSISGSTITGGTINGSNINVGGNGVGGQILIKDASGNTLCTLAPGGIRFDGGTIAGGTITGGTISGTAISGGTITGGAISGGSVTGTTISGGSITGTTISGGTITGGAISGGTISGTSMSGGTITGTTFNAETFNGGEFNGDVAFNCGDYFSIENVTDNRNYMFTLGGFQFGYDDYLRAHFFGSSNGRTDFEVTQDGNLYVAEIYPQDSWWDGWSLTRVSEKMWDEIYETGGILERLDALESGV